MQGCAGLCRAVQESIRFHLLDRRSEVKGFRVDRCCVCAEGYSLCVWGHGAAVRFCSEISHQPSTHPHTHTLTHSVLDGDHP